MQRAVGARRAVGNFAGAFFRVGDQIREVLTNRGGVNRRAAEERAVELFALVGLATDRLGNYPTSSRAACGNGR